MRVATVNAVRQQYGFCCGYCGISETDAGTTLTVDHFQPQSAGGLDAFSNLVYCCHACNEHKANFWNPDSPERLLHPIRDDVSSHVRQQDDGSLFGLTETGRFHIARLQLNRPALVRHRQTLSEGQKQRAERAAVVDVLNRVEEMLRELRLVISALHTGGE